MAIMLKALVSAVVLATTVKAIPPERALEFGYPTGVDVWNGSFEPGGWLYPPSLSPVPLLDLSIRPRMNLYLAGETYASFIIDAPLSYMHGGSFVNFTFNKADNITSSFSKLFIDASLFDGFDLIAGRNISVNSTGNEFVFSLSGLTPRLEKHEVVLTGASVDGAQFYVANTGFYYLPTRTDGGSVTKVDSLYGGLMVQDYLSNSTAWTSLFPYTFYVSWDGWLEFSKDRYNIIHIVPNAGLANQAFDFDELDRFLDIMDEMQLWLMFDMIITQVNRIKARKSMLLWYTGDEPDGQITYDQIKSLDPYHPVSLCLNCLNYYFKEYTSGADIILADPYPIAVNTSWSTQYNTICNTTYGCCGCDDCKGSFEDVSERLDLYTDYQEYLNLPQKPQWGVPQAFGNETFWKRYPTPAEELVMNMLFVNHGAKGIAMWSYPTEPGIANATSALSKVLTSTGVTSFLLGSDVSMLEVNGIERVDAASWIVGKRMMISVVNKNYLDSSTGNITIPLPANGTGVGSVLWGTSWNLVENSLVKAGMTALEVDIFTVNLG
ncbi:hypothetical protein HYALB_00005989 [Hymenoscyphus albidus]|uniref:Glycoside hydrolase subgroup catalytic core n=1 Tax=Hymenoscyphus albidus TaxID=595503 RepID=A0A9N9LQ06_9HELO|nr:hypothetical protein HYALB_00005989 [Hymenoscyphus albidus]